MRRVCGVAAVMAASFGIAACGGTTLPQAPAASPFSAASIKVSQTGNAPVKVDASSVSFRLDDARTLVGSVTVTSTASETTSVLVRVTLSSPSGAIIGDATGGQVQVPPNTPTTIPLSGPTPTGEIAAAQFEVSVPPGPTQTPGGGPTPEAQKQTPPPG